MNKFSFVGPNGKPFEIDGPPGATLEQARAIFQEQLSTGSLVGLVPGDVVSAATQATGGLKSALAQVQAFAADAKLPGLDLSAIPIVNGIDAADFIKQGAPGFGLGPLTSSDIQGLMSQAAATVGQQVDKVSAATGIGKFGLDLDKLEITGFLKPGTAEAYLKKSIDSVIPDDIKEAEKIIAAGGNITAEEISRNRQLNSFLTPAAFTGKDGVAELAGLLTDENIQDKIQGDVLKKSFSELSESGLLSKLPDTTQLAAALQTAATFDIDTAIKLVDNLGLPVPDSVKQVARAAEFAQSFSDKFADVLSSGSPLDAGIKAVRGEINRVNRDTVDASFTNLLGNPKIPTPAFTSALPATTAGVSGTDFTKAVQSIRLRQFGIRYTFITDSLTDKNRQDQINRATEVEQSASAIIEDANALKNEIQIKGGNVTFIQQLNEIIEFLNTAIELVSRRKRLAQEGYVIEY